MVEPMWKPVFILSCTLTFLDCFNAMHSHTFYVDSINGFNSASCNVDKPCETLGYVWNLFRAEQIINGTDLYGSIAFQLQPGFYDKQYESQPLTYSCLNTNVSMITLMTASSSNGSVTSQAQICKSISITNCNVVFQNIQFTRVKQCIKITDSKYVSMKNIQFKSNTHKPLLDVQSVQTVLIENMTLNHNKIIVDEEVYSLKFHEIKSLTFKTLKITKNENFMVLFRYVNQIYKNKVDVINNHHFAMVFAESVVNASRLNFENNDGNNASYPYVQLWYKSNATFKTTAATCNSYLNTKYGSPFQANGMSHIECINCVTNKCNVLCGAGEEISENVLCNKCPTGSSAHEWEIKCKKCRPGYYSSVIGSTDCVMCNDDTYCGKDGCSICSKCKNDFFTSVKGSSSCSRMSTLFIVLLACILLLTFTPIGIYMIRRSSPQHQQNENDNENDDDYLVDKTFESISTESLVVNS